MTSKNYRSNFALVDSGALQMAINVLTTAGKHEVVEELKKTIIQGLPPIPLEVSGIYSDWSNAIEKINICKTNTPVGISFTSCGRMHLDYSLTGPQVCSDIEDAHKKIFKHFVLDKMKV